MFRGLLLKLSFFLLGFSFVLVGLTTMSCSKTETASNVGGTGGTGDDDDDNTPPPSPLDSQPLLVLSDYLSDITPVSPHWALRAGNLQIFFGGTMPSLPVEIEGGTTGFRLIHRGASGDLRFETTTSSGFFWANMVSIPGTGTLNSTTVDMIFSSPIATWLNTGCGASGNSPCASAYSLVRVRGTHNAGNLNAELCVRTVSVTDWNEWGAPQNAVSRLFGQARQFGQYVAPSMADVASLRDTHVNCSNVGEYAEVPNQPVQRSLGFVNGLLEDILE